MKIPTSFRLFGQEIKVVFRDDLQFLDDAKGQAVFRMNRIELQSKTEQMPRPDDAIEHVFLHEMVHFLLYYALDDNFDPPLHQREDLVDRIAGLLHQAITTMKFEDDDTESA